MSTALCCSSTSSHIQEMPLDVLTQVSPSKFTSHSERKTNLLTDKSDPTETQAPQKRIINISNVPRASTNTEGIPTLSHNLNHHLPPQKTSKENLPPPCTFLLMLLTSDTTASSPPLAGPLFDHQFQVFPSEPDGFPACETYLRESTAPEEQSGGWQKSLPGLNPGIL